MKIFGLKIMRARKYNELCLTIVNAGKMVRKYTKHDGYSNYGQRVMIPLNDLSYIHCIENVIWGDVGSAILQEMPEEA